MEEKVNEIQSEVTFEEIDVINKILFWFIEEQGFKDEDIHEFMERSDVQIMAEHYINTKNN